MGDLDRAVADHDQERRTGRRARPGHGLIPPPHTLGYPPAVTETLAPDLITADREADPPRPARQWELDALRIAAIAGVLVIHVFGTLVSNPGWTGTRRWWIAQALDTGSIWVVPVFIMISGALVLAPRAHAAGPAAFYRKRFRRILPALIVWHLIYLLVVRIGLRGERPGAVGVTALAVDAKIWTALYFLWLIAGLYALAPVLAAFLRDGGPGRAMITAGVALSWTLLAFAISGTMALLGAPRPLFIGAWNQWWPYVGYFLAGWALHRVVLGRRGIVLAALVGAAALTEAVWQYGHPDHDVLQALLPVTRWGGVPAVASICVLLVAVGLGPRITPSPRVARALRTLSDASFGVFLVHLLIFEAIRHWVPVVSRASSLPVLLAAYAVVLVSSFAVSIGASKVRYLRGIF
jgi:surface polysaccharide O-acyltransferase-like enzyme